jgi:hypothetical protein
MASSGVAGLRVFNCFEHLFDDLRVHYGAAVKRHYHSTPGFLIDTVAALGSQPNEARFQQHRLGFTAVKRGGLGMNFDGGGEYLPAQRGRSFFISQCFKVKLSSLANISQRLFNRGPLGLATLQFRTPCIIPVPVLLDDNADFTRHYLKSSSSRHRHERNFGRIHRIIKLGHLDTERIHFLSRIRDRGFHQRDLL